VRPAKSVDNPAGPLAADLPPGLPMSEGLTRARGGLCWPRPKLGRGEIRRQRPSSRGARVRGRRRRGRWGGGWSRRAPRDRGCDGGAAVL